MQPIQAAETNTLPAAHIRQASSNGHNGAYAPLRVLIHRKAPALQRKTAHRFSARQARTKTATKYGRTDKTVFLVILPELPPARAFLYGASETANGYTKRSSLQTRSMPQR
jgi:hypothetical protein